MDLEYTVQNFSIRLQGDDMNEVEYDFVDKAFTSLGKQERSEKHIKAALIDIARYLRRVNESRSSVIVKTVKGQTKEIKFNY